MLEKRGLHTPRYRAAALSATIAGILLALASIDLFEKNFDADFILALPTILLRDSSRFESKHLTSLVLFAIGCFLYLTGARPIAAPEAAHFPDDYRLGPRTRDYYRALALVAYAATIWRYYSSGEDNAVRIGWISSMVFLLISALPMNRALRIGKVAKYKWPDIAFLLALGTFGISLHLFRLYDLPNWIHWDCAYSGSHARDLLQKEVKLFGPGPYFGISTLAFYPISFVMLASDMGLLGLRLSGVLFNALVLLLTFLIADQLLNRRAAFLSVLILSISYTFIHAGRIGAYNLDTPFGLAGLYFMILGLRQERMLFHVLSGMFVGHAYQIYFAGRVFVVVAVVCHLVRMLQDSGNLRIGFRGLCHLLAGALLMVGPNLLTEFMQHEQFSGRVYFVYAFSHLSFGSVDFFYHLWDQLVRSYLLMISFHDTDKQFWILRPIVDPLTGTLGMLGLVSCIRWVRKSTYVQILLCWFCVHIFCGSVLTVAPPPFRRLVGVLPCIAILAAIPIERAVNSFSLAFGGRHQSAGLSLAFGVLLYQGVNNFTFYLRIADRVFTRESEAARFVAKTEHDVDVCTISEFVGAPFGTFQFLVHPRAWRRIQRNELHLCTRRKVLFIFEPGDHELLDTLRSKFPEGISGVIAKDNETFYRVFAVGMTLPS